MELMTEDKKGLKKTDVGLIPEGWVVKQLGDICIKIQDGNYGESYPKSNEFVSSGVPFLTSKAIGKDGVLKPALIDFITKEKHNELEKAHLSLNDTLFTNRGASVGAIGFVVESISAGNIGPQLTLLRVDEDHFTPRFLYHAMKANFVQKQIRGQDSGSAMNFFGIGATKKFLIPIPPTLEEQQAIASALSDVDELIRSLDGLIQKKQAIKKGTMQQLLSGKKRLPGFDGEWEVKNLGDLGQAVIGLTYNKDDVQSYGTLVLRSSNIQDDRLAYDDNVFVSSNVKSEKYVQEGDVLICARNGSRRLIGKCAYIDKKAEGAAFGAFMAVLRSDFGKFIFYAFQSDLIQQQINEHLGATINQITNKSLRSFEIPFPNSEKERLAIVEVLDDMDQEIQTLRQKREKYVQIKQGMMQELLTGRVRLV